MRPHLNEHAVADFRASRRSRKRIWMNTACRTARTANAEGPGRRRQGQGVAGPVRPAPGQPLAGQPRAAQQEPHQRRLGRAPPAEPPRAASQGQRRPQQRQDVRLLAAPRRPVRHLPQQLLDVRAAVAASPTGCRHQRASLVPHRVPSPPDGFPSAQRARHPRRKAPVVLPMRLVARSIWSQEMAPYMRHSTGDSGEKRAGSKGAPGDELTETLSLTVRS